MSCSGCSASLDCDGDSDTLFPYSLTPGSPFPYVINCPTGVNCNTALSVTMECCGTPITADIPAGTSLEERAAILQRLVAQCSLLESGCSNPPVTPPGSPPPSPPPGGPIPPDTTLYRNYAKTANLDCSSTYGGGTYTTSVSAGTFMATTQAKADAMALEYVRALARANRFCLNAPCLCPCADVATTLNINTVGGTGPFTFSILSGTLPTGLTMAVVGGVLRVTGTPTVAGNSTISLKVFDSVGGYLTKSLTFYVIEITTSSPLPDYTVGEAYSQQLSTTGGVGPYVYSILSGSLPNGLTLSDEGLISGTPTESGDETFEVLAVDTGIIGHEGCSKEFELTGDDPPPEITEIYYPCETLTFIGPNSSSPNAAGAGSIFGIMSLTTGFIGNGLTVDLQIVAISPDSEVFLRFWYKTPPGAEGFEFLDMTGVHLHVIAGGFAQLQAGASTVDSTVPVNDGSWHRVVFMADTNNAVYRLKIDNNATQTIPIVGPSAVAGFAFNAGYIDEVFIIPSWMPSEANLLTDWNGGAGKTWPDASFQ